MKRARSIIKHWLSCLGDLAVDLSGLFLGYPEREGKPRRSVGEALLYLATIGAFLSILFSLM